MSPSAQDHPILNYHAAAPQIEWFSDGSVIITVPARRSVLSYGISFAAKSMVDLLAIPLFPLSFVAGVVMFALFGKQTPRAILRVGPDEVSLTACRNDSLGRRTTFASWKRTEILEFRANNADPGLYMRLAGKDSLCLLRDLPTEWSAQIGAALTKSLDQLGKASQIQK
jgi:hypothetical protein